MILKHFRFYLLSLAISLAVSGIHNTALADQYDVRFSDIRHFAGLASAAYTGKSSIVDKEVAGDYTLTRYSNIPGYNIACFVMTSETDQNQIIVVRGTSNIENALVDADLKLTKDKLINIRLHNGFAVAARAIYNDIKPVLKKEFTISTTGHSLGGAAALILAMYMDADDYKTDRIITFGQPKVTNVTGARTFGHLNVIRVVTSEDIVPLVPPLDITDINNIDIYWHLGKEIILLKGNTYAVLDGLDSMLRATRFTQQPLSENNLNHHQITLYLDMIDKKIPEARQVKYENNLNLFNLFGGDKQ